MNEGLIVACVTAIVLFIVVGILLIKCMCDHDKLVAELSKARYENYSKSDTISDNTAKIVAYRMMIAKMTEAMELDPDKPNKPE